MKTLYRTFDDTVDKAYIIRMSNNAISTQLALRAALSCEKIGMNYEFHEAFDGTGSEIIVPNHCKDQSYITWLKLMDHQLSLSEVGCCLSHISLWAKCVELDRPIVVLEHDSIMVRKYERHRVYNSICYLGDDNPNTPAKDLYCKINHNWVFINRAHAYAIDPFSAKKLLVGVIDRGVYEAADVMMRIDDVAIIQEAVYAYCDPSYSTITNRK